ncbi:MAG: hypothetical protein ABW208_13620 [Pyrinomonadaceae bacterium]
MHDKFPAHCRRHAVKATPQPQSSPEQARTRTEGAASVTRTITNTSNIPSFFTNM